MVLGLVFLFLLLLNMKPVGPLFVFSENFVVGVAEEAAGEGVDFFLLPFGWTMVPLQGVDGVIGAGAGGLTRFWYWEVLRTPVLDERPSLTGEWIRAFFDAAASSSTVSCDSGLAAATVGRLPEVVAFSAVPCWKGGAYGGGSCTAVDPAVVFDVFPFSSSIGSFVASLVSSTSCISWSAANTAACNRRCSSFLLLAASISTRFASSRGEALFGTSVTSCDFVGMVVGVVIRFVLGGRTRYHLEIEDPS